MPTSIKQDGFRIVIYPNDHLPSHVHVIKGDGEVRISLNTVRLTKKWNISERYDKVFSL